MRCRAGASPACMASCASSASRCRRRRRVAGLRRRARCGPGRRRCAERRSPAALPEGYVSEVCLRVCALDRLAVATAWRAASCCSATTGCRGRTTTTRSAAAARCAVTSGSALHDDPYINLGVQDITAWVDFTRVAEAASSAKLTVAGFATQAAYLLGLGLPELVAEAERGSPLHVRGSPARRGDC